MRASSLWTSSALLASGSLAELIAPSRSTSDPTITPAPQVPVELFKKQNDDRFMGWLLYSGTWISRTCDYGGTYYQDGEYWRCCATSLAGCNVALGCVAGSLIYSVTTDTVNYRTIACTDLYTDSSDASFTVCNTGFLYENTLDTDPMTNIFCGVRSVNWSYYRVKPDSSTPSSEPSSTTPSSSPRSTPATPTQASQTSTSSPTAAPEPEKKESKAWIAGVVIGPLAALALAGALLWFFLVKRKKNKTPPPQPPMQQTQSGMPGPYPPSNYPASPPVPQQEYYKPQMNQQLPPYMMAPGGVASHNSWAPQSPNTQGSQSPNPPQSPYGGPPPAQQWQPMPQNQQLYNQSASPPPQSTSPAQVHAYKAGDNGVVGSQPGVSQRPFSSELDGTTYQQQDQPR